MISEEILELAKAQGVMISIAESCTGGMVIAALTDIAGSSSVVDRGFVTYSNAAKTQMLGVAPETLAEHGAVSEPVAREMADGALSHSAAQLSVSVTGIAGPGGSEHKPEGRVCFGLARKGLKTFTETKDFGSIGRAEVRRKSRDHALVLLSRALS
ncbi:MAG: CinA family protein [Pseudomonadota bacterium]